MVLPSGGSTSRSRSPRSPSSASGVEKIAESVTETVFLTPVCLLGLGFACYAVGAYLLGGACGSLFGPPALASNPAQGFAGSPIPEPMSLIPRWRYMTDEAKALTKRTAVSALVVLLVLLVFRALVPWVLMAVVAWWIWKAVSK